MTESKSSLNRVKNEMENPTELNDSLRSCPGTERSQSPSLAQCLGVCFVFVIASSSLMVLDWPERQPSTYTSVVEISA